MTARPTANPGVLTSPHPNLLNLKHLQRHPGSWATPSLRRKAQGRYAEGEPLTLA